MAFAFVANTLKAPGANGGATDAIDTTGATLLVLVISAINAVALGGTPTDSKGNTWTARTVYSSGGNGAVRVWYAENPVVGSGHTFTYTRASSFPVIMAIAVSGAALASVYDVENGAGQVGGTTLQPGSVTPSAANALLVAGTGIDGVGRTATINASFTGLIGIAGDGATRMGGYAAHLIQGAAAAVNPTWTYSGAVSRVAANITVFKAAASSGTNIDPPTIASTATVHAATIVAGTLLSPGFIPSIEQVFAPEIIPGGTPTPAPVYTGLGGDAGGGAFGPISRERWRSWERAITESMREKPRSSRKGRSAQPKAKAIEAAIRKLNLPEPVVQEVLEQWKEREQIPSIRAIAIALGGYRINTRMGTASVETGSAAIALPYRSRAFVGFVAVDAVQNPTDEQIIQMLLSS
jgi:hypothetical protein